MYFLSLPLPMACITPIDSSSFRRIYAVVRFRPNVRPKSSRVMLSCVLKYVISCGMSCSAIGAMATPVVGLHTKVGLPMASRKSCAGWNFTPFTTMLCMRLLLSGCISASVPMDSLNEPSMGMLTVLPSLSRSAMASVRSLRAALALPLESEPRDAISCANCCSLIISLSVIRGNSCDFSSLASPSSSSLGIARTSSALLSLVRRTLLGGLTCHSMFR